MKIYIYMCIYIYMYIYIYTGVSSTSNGVLVMYETLMGYGTIVS